MTCPSRKNKMVCQMIQDRKSKENKKEKAEDKQITDEEHKKRLELLKQMGLIK